MTCARTRWMRRRFGRWSERYLWRIARTTATRTSRPGIRLPRTGSDERIRLGNESFRVAEADVTTEQQTPRDWPRRLHDALAPLADEIRQLAGHYRAHAEHGPPVFQTDAVKLERAAGALGTAVSELMHIDV